VDHKIEFSPEALGHLIDCMTLSLSVIAKNGRWATSTASRNAVRVLPYFRAGERSATICAAVYALLGFERLAVIAFRHQKDPVTILRIHGGSDIKTAFPRLRRFNAWDFDRVRSSSSDCGSGRIVALQKFR